jgi:hypothetical protein
MKPKLHALTDAEHATVLAALNYYHQIVYDGSLLDLPIDIQGLANNHGTITPLDARQIDKLCENLNHPGLDFTQACALFAVDDADPHVAAARCRYQFSESINIAEPAVTSACDDGADVLAWVRVTDEEAGG